MKKRVYTASRVWHAPKWLALRESGVSVIATWIDEAGEGESASLSNLWVRCVSEAAIADVLLLYCEPDDLPLKGALVEVGAALANGKPVYVVGDIPASWVHHPLVKRCESVDAFVAEVLFGPTVGP